MKMKNLLGAITLAVVLIGGTNFAFANNHNHNSVELTAEQQTQYDTMCDSYDAKVKPLQNKLRYKYMELNAYKSNPNVKPDQISKIINEIASIENEISTQYDQFAKNVKDKLGIEVSKHTGHGQCGSGSCGKNNHNGEHSKNGHQGNHNQHNEHKQHKNA